MTEHVDVEGRAGTWLVVANQAHTPPYQTSFSVWKYDTESHDFVNLQVWAFFFSFYQFMFGLPEIWL